MSPDGNLVIEVFGEGKADVGRHDGARPPTEGVVPILTHKLCGKPKRMLVKRQAYAMLQGKGRWQKVRFAKRQAHYNKTTDGVVFVLDSEGDQKKLESARKDLEKGRDADALSIPMAVGVAHPCIESWLLADATAIRRGLKLGKSPKVPEEPENLSAPCMDRDKKRNPKTVLARAAGSTKKELSAKQKDKIAMAVNDLELLRKRCPAGFGPFADEVQRHIRPLCET